jgi:uncharacterized membrane protein
MQSKRSALKYLKFNNYGGHFGLTAADFHVRLAKVIASPSARSPLTLLAFCCCSLLAQSALAIVGTDGVTSFTPLGLNGGAAHSSYAYAVSADGSVVAGTLIRNDNFDYKAFRWTAADGMALLPDLPYGRGASGASGISADGGVIVGGGVIDNSGGDAVRWTAPSYSISPFLENSSAVAASADGSIIAGVRTTGGHTQSYRWTEAGGAIDIAPSTYDSQPTGMTPDGSLIVGYVYVGNTYRGYRWTSATGDILLEDLPGGLNFSQALAVSGDGWVVVGFSSSDRNNNGEAVMWDASGVHPLFDGPFGPYPGTISATGVSYDGSVIVGQYETGAFIWDANNGVHNLQSTLSGRGIDMTGWLLTKPTAISSDGRTIVGFGTNPLGQTEGWVAVIPAVVPEPSAFLLLGMSGACALIVTTRIGRRRHSSAQLDE